MRLAYGYQLDILDQIEEDTAWFKGSHERCTSTVACPTQVAEIRQQLVCCGAKQVRAASTQPRMTHAAFLHLLLSKTDCVWSVHRYIPILADTHLAQVFTNRMV